MIARPPTNRTGTDVLRAVGNLAWTTAIVVAAPLLLAHVFGYPLPRQNPDWGEVFSTPMQLVEPQVIINIFVCLGWIVWGIVIAYVIVDLIDLARGVGHRVRRLGPASVVAGKLVASVALLVSLLRPQPATTSTGARPAPTEQVIEVATAPAGGLPTNIVLVRADTPAPASKSPASNPTRSSGPAPTYIVKRGDSLWRIAEQQLGSGFRWHEIHELNRPLIANPDLICTGWTLTLPADALRPDTPPFSQDTPSAPDALSTSSPVPANSTPAAPPPTTPAPPPAPATHAPAPLPATSAAPTTDTASTTPDQSTVVTQPPTAVPSAPGISAPAAPTTATASTDPAPPTSGSTLPLALRAQGFTTQDQYAAWLAQQQPDTDDASELSTTARDAIVAGAVTVPALLAAGVVGSINRRRRRVLQHRPIHAPLPVRDPDLRPVEAHFRSSAGTDPATQIAWIDIVLRQLGAAFSLAPAAGNLVLLRPTGRHIEVLWDQPPTGSCPDGFAPGDTPQTWDYPYGDPVELAALQGHLAGVPHLANALVTLGDTPDGPVLINLQAVDEIDLAGDPVAVTAWLAAVTVELESHRWAEPVDSALTLPAAVPTRLHTSIHIDDSGKARPLVWRTDRVEPPAPWQLTITPRTAELSNDLAGFATHLNAVGIDDTTFNDATALLAEASRDPYREGGNDHDDAAPTPPPHDPELDTTSAPTPIDTSRHDARLTVSADDPAAQQDETFADTLVIDQPPIEPDIDFTQGASLVVRVLGPVRTDGWKTRPKSPRTEDIVVYLAMARPGAVSRQRLIDALWNGKNVSDKLLYNYMGTLRKEIGDAEAVISSDGAYALADTVRCDWDHFTELVHAARDQSWPQRRAALGAALMLVHGRPFDVIDDRYQWASTDGTMSRLEVAVTDTAAELAAEAIEHGDYAMALWAARRGLDACPWLVRMYGYMLEAHAGAGDAIALEHTWRELQRAAGDDAVPEELAALYSLARPR